MTTLEQRMRDPVSGLATTLSEREKEKEKKREAKKDLNFYDSNQIQYEPINKNLYIQCKEISDMTAKQVSEFRKSYGDIKVRGVNCPRPIQNWH